jgi:hypothetical protein
VSRYGGIREALAGSLSSLGIQSSGYLMAAPTPPAIECFPGQTDYDSTFQRGMDEVVFVVRITVSVNLDVGAQMKLDEYLDPTGTSSVKALIEADRTLGGRVKDLRVETVTGHEVSLVEGNHVLSCDWTVRIYL